GMNPLFAGDAAYDLDGDGLDALDEFLGATDPDTDNRAPTLVTPSLLVPAGGTAGFYIGLADSDSVASELELGFPQVVTGLTPRFSGTLLATNDTFTYADVLAGSISLDVAADLSIVVLPLSLLDIAAPATNPAVQVDLLVKTFSPANQVGQVPATWLSASGPEALLNDGDSIEEWADASGSAREAYQPYVASRPLLSTGAVPRVVFSADDFLYVDDLGLSLTNVAGFAAFSISEVSTNDQVVFSNGDLQVLVGGTDNPTHAHALHIIQNGREVSGPVVPVQELIQLSWVGGSISSFATVSGGALYPSAETADSLLPAFATIGSLQDFWMAEPASHLSGSIYELLLYDELLEAGHRARNEDYQRSRWGDLLVWDFASETAALQLTGQTGSRNSLNGGWGADSLIGSDADDTLRGGPSDDLLTGNGGANRFQFFVGHGNDTVLDFSEDQGDILDFSPIFANRRGTPDEVLSLRFVVTRDTNNIPRVDTIIDVDEDGDSTIDQYVTLRGVAYGDADLPRLTGEGVIQLGGPQFDAALTLTASETALIETEVARTLTLTRSGNVAAAMDVQLSFVGTAGADTDYALTDAHGTGIIRTVSFAQGVASQTIDLTPIQDRLSESEEINVAVLAMPEVTSVPGAALTLTLDDAPEISIEALVGYTIQGGPAPGIVRISRSGPTDQPLDLDLTFAGPAVNGADYQLVSPAFSLPAGVSSVQFEVTALTGSSLTNLPAEAEFSIVEDKTQYALASELPTLVYILGSLDDQWNSYGLWQIVNLSGSDGDFGGDTEGDGLLNGLEYVYGTDPTVVTTDPKAGRIELVNDGGFLEIRLTTISPLDDVTLGIEGADDLLSATWIDVTDQFTLSTSNTVSPFVSRTYRSTLPVAESQLHYRLSITKQVEP
ncbi:MAG: hypothetical protein GY701_17060, partial [Sulfitobacter sp.]|nr:hypothetical protein [Sulfitobacter sp.]